MTELVNAIVSEAKHTEPFLKLPGYLKKLLQTPFSASTADLQNIVKSKKIPKFLHSGLYYSNIAKEQVGDELLKSCNKLAEQVGDIWRYLNIIDPSIVVPPDSNDIFDFTSLKQNDNYDTKLTARYWAQEINTLLLEIDSACRLAIKQQSRIVLCLFEVCNIETSVQAAYTILMYTQQLQKEKENIRDSYIEFAKVYASMIDSLDISVLKEKVTTESILYQTLEMDSSLIDHIEWLQKMLYILPNTTIEVWYQQFVFIGNWMNRLFVPWMKKMSYIFTGLYPPHVKKGPIETVSKAFAQSQSIPLKVSEIKMVSQVLTDLHVEKDISKTQMDPLDTLCIQRTGMNLLDWAVILDMSLEYEEDLLIKGRLPEVIQKDINAAKQKKQEADDALDAYLRERLKISPENALYKAFATRVKDNYENVNKKELLKEKNRYFTQTMTDEDFEYLVDYLVDVHKAAAKWMQYEIEMRAPHSKRARVTLTLQSDIAEAKIRLKETEQAFLKESQIRLRNQFVLDRWINYLKWYNNDGYLLQMDKSGFQKETYDRLQVPWEDFEPLFTLLKDVAQANTKLISLEIELKNHKNNLVLGKNVLSVLFFMLFGGLSILFLFWFLFPVYEDTIIGLPTNITTNQTIIPLNITTNSTTLTQMTWAESMEKLKSGVDAIWNIGYTYVDKTIITPVYDSKPIQYIVEKISGKVHDKAQEMGMEAFDWNRLFSKKFLLDELPRGAGPWIMNLLYGKALISIGWSATNMLWAVSTGFGNTLVDTFDHNFTETWRIERQNIVGEAQNNMRAVTASIATLIEFHSENAKGTMMVLAQTLQHLPGGTFTRVIAARLEEYGTSPTQHLTQQQQSTQNWINNNNNDPEVNGLPRPFPDRNIIEGPRVTELADTYDQTNKSTAIIPFSPNNIVSRDDF